MPRVRGIYSFGIPEMCGVAMAFLADQRGRLEGGGFGSGHTERYTQKRAVIESFDKIVCLNDISTYNVHDICIFQLQELILAD